jgi:hypothetical protein
VSADARPLDALPDDDVEVGAELERPEPVLEHDAVALARLDLGHGGDDRDPAEHRRDLAHRAPDRVRRGGHAQRLRELVAHLQAP